mgnify:CR=1 FL=1
MIISVYFYISGRIYGQPSSKRFYDQSLSNNELNILKYVYEHGDAIVDMNIREFSAQVSYSSATILRFAGNWDIPDLQNLSISCAIKL